MRKTFWIVLTLLLLAFLAPGAHADSYTATFVCTYGGCGSTPTAPSVDSSNSPTLTVNEAGFVFSIALPADFAYGDQWMWHMTMFCEQNGMCVADEEFDLNDMTTGAALSDRLYAVANPLNFADMGTLTFTDVTPPIATPEPSSIVLLCAGVGVALALRKLIS